jgi:hypothetical protein
VITSEQGERWHHAPVGHSIAGPCPRCLRDGKRLNSCQHQLPEGLGYVVASFTLVDNILKEDS